MSLNNETDTYEFYGMVARGKHLFNLLLAQYGHAIRREELEESPNQLLIHSYREYKELLKKSYRNLIKLGSTAEVYDVIKTHSVLYKSNVEKFRNHEPLAVLR